VCPAPLVAPRPHRKHVRRRICAVLSVAISVQVLADIMKDKEAFWMTKKEYDEKGMEVLSKCF
jgi:hypothetical protein